MPYLLGKKAVKKDPRNLQLRRYLRPGLPTPPASCNWLGGNTAWPMLLNDQIGDCVFASIAHQVQAWTGVSKKTPAVLRGGDVLRAYEGCTGYNPAVQSTDQGTYWLDGLNFWRKTGVGGHKIDAYVQLRAGSQADLEESVTLFGGVSLGLALPLTAQDQIEAKQVWWTNYSAGDRAMAGSWGGHAVPILCYSAAALWCVTWGQLQQMTWDFYRAYADEAYAAISEADWLASGKSPGGFDFATLAADLSALKAA